MCHVFAGDAFVFVFVRFNISLWFFFMSVIVLARDGNPFPGVVPCSCLTLCVHMLCGSCTGGICCFSCGLCAVCYILYLEVDYECGD